MVAAIAEAAVTRVVESLFLWTGGVVWVLVLSAVTAWSVVWAVEWLTDLVRGKR